MNATCDSPRWLSTPAALSIAALAVSSLHAAYTWTSAGVVVVVYLAGMYRLAWVKSTRWAFYLGLGVGLAVAAPRLFFFAGIFGPAAVGLWLVLGLWHAAFLLVARSAVGTWPRIGPLLLPVVWFGLEYARSELYYLRFSWLTPGFALCHPYWLPLVSAGVYGFSFLAMLVIATADAALRHTRRGIREGSPSAFAISSLVAMTAACLSGAATNTLLRSASETAAARGPLIVGLQLEGASDAMIFEAMESAVGQHSRLDLLVLSEYAFDGPIPDEARQWCRRHRKFLIAGGKDYIDDSDSPGDYENTVYVVAPTGREVFRQVKSVPVQFMRDGRPASSQGVWESPWGRIGIAICYDLSYARVIDRLIEMEAQALIVPAMELEEWGEQEHMLHENVAPVRAREYGVPIFRLVSSGTSQLVDDSGRVRRRAPFPGINEQIVGKLPISEPGRLPLDRWLALPACGLTVGLALWLWLHSVRRQASKPKARQSPRF